MDDWQIFSLAELNFPATELAFVFGNAPNLNAVSVDDIGSFESLGPRIGVNRAFLKAPMDIVVWTDDEIWPDIAAHRFEQRVTIIRVLRPGGHPRQIRWWMKHRDLTEWRRGLFFLRNTLVSALHLCFRSGIRKIVLFGVSLESKSYFYDSDTGTSPVAPYEHHDRETIDRLFHGYDIQRCVREVIEYLLAQDLDIRYVGKSHFLAELGLKGYENLQQLKSDHAFLGYYQEKDNG